VYFIENQLSKSITSGIASSCAGVGRMSPPEHENAFGSYDLGSLKSVVESAILGSL
jgi:hypothetical protein